MSSAIELKKRVLAEALEGAPQSESEFLTDIELNVLSSFPGAVALFMGNGQQIWANQAIEDLVGSTNNWLDNVNPQYAVGVFQVISAASAEGLSGDCIIKTQTLEQGGNAQTRTLSINCRPFMPAQRTFKEAFALITIEDKTAENELEIQLANAKQETDDKNRFFSSMSHELRTPLNAIIGFAELLEGKAAIQLDDIKRLEYAGLISGSANHLLGLINDILDLSRLDAGKSEATSEAIDVDVSLRTVVRSMMPIAMRRGIDVIVEDTGLMPPLYSDKRALTQILTNILSNAIKFSHENGVVRLKTHRLRNRIKIVISDSGIGMNTETQSKLGGLFYQSGDVIRGDYGGSGLGLSIVYKLVELLGGKIAVISRPNEGTTISVILPSGAEETTPVPASSDSDVVYLTADREERNANKPETTIKSGVYV